MSLITCSPYSVTFPAVAICGPFTACPGQVITASTCDSCFGDTDLSLFDASGVEVWGGDDGCSHDNFCSIFSYDVPLNGACQEYTISQGCYQGYSCSATTQVSVNSPVPTVAPSAAPNAYVQYFHNADCSGGTAGTATVDSNACTPYAGYPSFVFEVKCPSNNPNATWIANAYTHGDCYGTPYQTNTGNGGACDECIYVQNTGWSYKVNCGPELAPGCTAPPSLEPTPGPPTAEPTLPNPTAAPSKGVEAYVQYFDDWVCDNPSTYVGSAVVDSGACTVYGANTYALDVQCDSNTADSAWTATGYFDGDLTCQGTGSYMTYSGTGACSCTWLMMTFQSVMINCGSQPVDCTAAPTVVPTFAPTAVATIAPSKGVEVYLQYFYANDCFSTLVNSAVIDSGACTPATYNSYYTFNIQCDSNSVDSAWTAQVFTGWNSGCSGTPYETLSGSGNCECQEVGGYKFSVNCGSAPMSCAAPPTMEPTTAAPIAPTPAPSKGIEAYVKYFYDSSCFGEPAQQFVVDSGACNSNYPWTTLQVNCQANNPSASWIADVYNYDFDATCNLAPYQVLEGSGPCGECTFVSALGFYVEINCGGLDGCPSDPYAEPSIAPTETLAPGAYVTVYQDKTCSSGYTEGDRIPLKKCVRIGYSGLFGNFTCDSMSAASNWTSQVYSDPSCSTQLDTVEGGSACDCFAFSGANSRSYSITMNCNGAEDFPCPTPEPTQYPSNGPVAVIQLYETNSCSAQGSTDTTSVNLDECRYLSNGYYSKFTCETLSLLSPWTYTVYSDSTCSGEPVKSLNGADSCDCMTFNGTYSQGHSARLNCAGWQTPVWQCPATGGGYLQVYQADTCTGNNGGGNAPLNQCLKLGYSSYYGNFTCDSRASSSAWTATVYTDNACSSSFTTLTGTGACDCTVLGSYGLSMNCAGGAPAQCFPTVVPSVAPSVLSTLLPTSTSEPSAGPTSTPVPSAVPTATSVPTAAATNATFAPSALPTFVPSATSAPVVTPTAVPSVAPSVLPTFVPSATAAPMVTPTAVPSSALPTFVPSATAAPMVTPTAVPSVVPTAAHSGMLTVYDSNTCSSSADSVYGMVPLNTCVAMSTSGLYTTLTCESLSSKAEWNATIYQNSNCAGGAAYIVHGDSADSCVTAGGLYSLTLDCGAGAKSSSSSSSKMSSGEVGGIVGGVVGGVLVLTLIGLWTAGMIGFGAASAGAAGGAAGGAAAAAAAAAAAGGAAASAPVDVEMATVNPIAPPGV